MQCYFFLHAKMQWNFHFSTAPSALLDQHFIKYYKNLCDKLFLHLCYFKPRHVWQILNYYLALLVLPFLASPLVLPLAIFFFMLLVLVICLLAHFLTVCIHVCLSKWCLSLECCTCMYQLKKESLLGMQIGHSKYFKQS